jgi:hypothetical protein
MQETWLRTNRRILLLGMILPAVLILGGLIVVAVAQSGVRAWFYYVGLAAAAFGLALFVILLPQIFRPRLAYAEGEMLVYLRAGRPIRLPVEIVECFFVGAGVGQLPGAAGQEIPLRNLVLRVAEKATDFQHRDVKAALGRWDDGYVVFHGAWCEPLNLALVKRLNARLADAQRSQLQHRSAPEKAD